MSALTRPFLQVRSWKDDRHSVAYEMQPITDFNEVTMHCLEIIYTHLFNTKGPLPGKGSVGGGAAVAQPVHVSRGVDHRRALLLPEMRGRPEKWVWHGPRLSEGVRGGEYLTGGKASKALKVYLFLIVLMSLARNVQPLIQPIAFDVYAVHLSGRRFPGFPRR